MYSREDFAVFNQNKEICDVRCKGCGSVMKSRSQNVCQDCGTHNNDTHLDFSPEWTDGTNDGTLKRCNTLIDPLLSKMSVSTYFYGVPREISRLHIHNSGYKYEERSRSQIFNLMDKIAIENNIPQAAIAFAKKLLKNIQDQDLQRGNCRYGIIGACILYGCNYKGIMVGPKDIAKFMKLDNKYLTNGQNKVMKYCHDKQLNNIHKTHLVSEYVVNYMKMLEINNISRSFNRRVIRIAELIDPRVELFTSRAYSLATGVIYYVAMYHKKIDHIAVKKKICQRCKISDATIQKCYQILEDISNDTYE